ncbi:MAG: DUF4434 domain-containing protein [Clostridia bacterium]|nr:DUF4434 domain-containing protein [Clostridia bacterium]
MKKGPITGTFIDDVTYDIPSSNWSRAQWRADFDNMQEIGIDTLIFIRGGFEDRAIFPAKSFDTYCKDDFAGFVFEEATKRNMDIFFGMYISNLDWNDGDYLGEIHKNKTFMDEVLSRYGDYPAFKGWYIPQEAAFDNLNFAEIMRGMSALCKDKSPDKKVLISPFFKTKITYPEDYFTPQQHFEEWSRLFSYGGKDIDICAFQDGTAPMPLMDEFYGLTAQLCKEYKIEHWVNAETFERDVRAMYYPITFELLKARLEKHKNYAEKIITFEFSHFLSPQSIYPSARNLNNLYKEYFLR